MMERTWWLKSPPPLGTICGYKVASFPSPLFSRNLFPLLHLTVFSLAGHGLIRILLGILPMVTLVSIGFQSLPQEHIKGYLPTTWRQSLRNHHWYNKIVIVIHRVKYILPCLAYLCIYPLHISTQTRLWADGLDGEVVLLYIS